MSFKTHTGHDLKVGDFIMDFKIWKRGTISKFLLNGDAHIFYTDGESAYIPAYQIQKRLVKTQPQFRAPSLLDNEFYVDRATWGEGRKNSKISLGLFAGTVIATILLLGVWFL